MRRARSKQTKGCKVVRCMMERSIMHDKCSVVTASPPIFTSTDLLFAIGSDLFEAQCQGDDR